MSVFDFDVSAAGVPSLTACVSRGIVKKSQLLDELGVALQFPEYYGVNWDALEECLRDLSWLPPGLIVIVHSDLPLRGNVQEQLTYISVLAGAVAKHRAPQPAGRRRLAVVFPAESREQVEYLLQKIERA